MTTLEREVPGPKMPLFLLWWDNCLEYDDHRVTLLGIYTDPDFREDAERWYALLAGRQWPFNEDGRFVREDQRADTELVEKHPQVKL